MPDAAQTDSLPEAARLVTRLPQLRAHMVDALYRIMLVGGGVLVAGNIARALATGWKPLYLVYVALYLIFVSLHVLRAHVALWVRESFAVGLMFVGGTAGYLQFGPIGNTNPVYLGVIFIAAAFYGMRAAIWAAAGCVVTLGVATAAFHLSGRPVGFDPAAYLHNPLSWVAACATVLAIGALVVVQSSRLLEWLADWILTGREANRVLGDQVQAQARIETELRLSEQMFAAAFRASPDWISLHRMDDGAILEVNPAFERLTGYAHDAVLGRDPAQLPIWQLPEDWARVRRAAADDRPLFDLPVQMRAADGRQRELLVNARRTEAGGLTAILVVARDVTEPNRARHGRDALRAELERRVAERTEALRAARAELEGFVASASLDLRAPLRAIESEERELRAALAGRVDAEGTELLGRLERASQQATQLVDSLIELARVNRREPAREPVDLGAMAAELVDTLRRGEPGRQVEVRIDADLHAVGDAELMRAALGQLLSNAWKFTAGTPQACIEFCRGGEAGEFVVRDNGAGFDMAYAAKLFRPFERLHPPGAFPGLGIGLALAASAIHRHGGAIHAESAPDRGATFRFTLAPRPEAA